jgi:hypothetical protein
MRRCPQCDRLMVSDVIFAHSQNCGSCEECSPFLTEDYCWGGVECQEKRVDWRARAVAAETVLRRWGQRSIEYLERYPQRPDAATSITGLFESWSAWPNDPPMFEAWRAALKAAKKLARERKE